MPTSLLGNDEVNTLKKRTLIPVPRRAVQTLHFQDKSRLCLSDSKTLYRRLSLRRLTADSYKPEVPASKSKGDDLSDLRTKEIFPLLVRASDGDRLKISTVVQQSELVSFFGKYGEVCKNGMQGLKKRDRKKEKAKKEKKKVEKK
jgi:signal recognition particle subunit SRP14